MFSTTYRGGHHGKIALYTRVRIAWVRAPETSPYTAQTSHGYSVLSARVVYMFVVIIVIYFIII